MVEYTSGPRIIRYIRNLILTTGAALLLMVIQSCSVSKAEPAAAILPVPVLIVDTAAATTYKHYATSLRGITDIEVRPQVEGYLEKIYVDEGQFVQAGASLFLIHAAPYEAQLNNAAAALQTAKAQEEKAGIEVARLERLVAGKVMAPVQLDNARATLQAAKSSVAQAEATRRSAAISQGFTHVRAAVSGYVGILPYKIGSLVGRNEPQPLTVLSDTRKVHAYFSMSEKDFLQFKHSYEGNSMEEKISRIPPISLLLPDNTEYPEKGKVEIVNGQVDRQTAAITFRASFPNAGSLLRSGNTGTILLPQRQPGVIRIPQTVTFEVQNKVMAYIVDKNNKVVAAPLTIAGKDAGSYIISAGLKRGDRIVADGLDRLQEGMQVTPQQK